MPKNIIFCADGTWNGPGAGDDEGQEVVGATNVLKTFANLAGKRALATLKLSDEEESALTDPATGEVLQVAKYIHGVGDSDNFLVKLLGGTVGAGLVTRIVRGYTFISRNYRAGDRIFLVGFSRGAYTARALGGLICSQGLIDATQVDLTSDKDVAYRWGSAVWYQSRKGSLAGSPTLLGRLENLVLDFPSFFLRPPAPEMMIAAPIATIGVWDTVGSLGIPQYDLKTGEHIDALRFTDTQLSDKVAMGFHAVSLDERRGDFTPTLWDVRAGVEQCLFAGAHADVGGGYSDGGDTGGLSDIALAWMTAKLQAAGVLYSANPAYTPRPNFGGVAHAPWDDVPWKALPQSARSFPELLRKNGLDPSVASRMQVGDVLGNPKAKPGPYKPGNL